jgi:hypothetical protein
LGEEKSPRRERLRRGYQRGARCGEKFRIGNFRFQMRRKQKRKNVKPAALKGGATEATARRRRDAGGTKGKKQTRGKKEDPRYEKQTCGARSKLVV